MGKASGINSQTSGARAANPASELPRCVPRLGAWAALCLPVFFLWAAADRGSTFAEEMPKIPLWDFSASLRAAAGYKDNVTLSHFGAEASPVFMSGLDVLLFRLPTGGTELSFMFNAEDTRFLTARAADKEQTFFALASLKHQCAEGWGGGFAMQYFYLDQVLDASTLDYGMGSVQARGHSLILTPSFRRELGEAFALELEFPFSRSYYARPLDDYWEGGPKLALKHTYGWRSELTASYQIARRPYDNRVQAAATGEFLPGKALEFLVQRLEAAWRHHWDRRRHWRSALRLGAEITQDNGPGYFDSKRYFASEQLRFRAAGWELSARSSQSFYDYALQTVSPVDPSKRNKLLLTAGFRIEKALAKKLKLFSEFEHERSFSNVTYDAYQVNTLHGGLEWEL